MSNGILHTEALVIGHVPVPLRAPIALHATPGTITAVLGNNGSGKTTLLRTLAGVLPAVSGRVLLHGKDIHAWSGRERAREVAVVLAQRPRTGLMRAADVVWLGRLPWAKGWGRDALGEERVHDALRLTGSMPLADRPFHELSDGEAQRILVARALAQEARLLLLDEPTAFLDISQRAMLMRMLQVIARERGLTVLLATHDLQQALDTADRVLVLDRTGGWFQGSPSDALDQGVIASAFAVDGLSFDAMARVFRPSA